MKSLKPVVIAIFMALLSTPALADFSGAYSFANWTASAGPSGAIDTSDPTTLFMLSGDFGYGESETFLIAAPTAVTISFDWNYGTFDSDASRDPFFFYKTSAGNVCLACSGFMPASGSYSTTVESLEVFGFNLSTVDGIGGFSLAQITNFQAVALVPEPETYAMLLAGLGLLGFAARRRKLKLAA